MSETSNHSVVPCLVRMRLCFVLAVWAANAWVARAASGKEGNSRSHVTFTTKPAKKSYPPTAPPIPYTDQARVTFARQNFGGARPKQVDKGELVRQLSSVFEQQNKNGAKSQPPPRPLVPQNGAGVHRVRSDGASVKSERPPVPRSAVPGRKCTAELKHCFETGPNGPPQECSASKTEGFGFRKGKEGLGSAARPIHSPEVTSVETTGRSPSGRFFTTKNTSDHSGKKPQYPSPRALCKERAATTKLTNAQFGSSSDGRASKTATHFLKKGCGRVEPTVLKPTSLPGSDPPQCKPHRNVPVAKEVASGHRDELAARAGYAAQEPRKARRPQEMAGLFTRRRSGRGKRASQKNWGSWARGRARAVTQVCSWVYAPVAIPLMLAGFIIADPLLTVAGSVLLSGGVMLNVLSLLALRLRRVQVTELIPFTAYNFNLFFRLLPTVYYSTIFLLSYFFVSYCIAFARTRLSHFLYWVAPLTAVLIGMGFFRALARTCGMLRSSRSPEEAADPESMMSSMEMEGLVFDFEMFASDTAEANNGSTPSAPRSCMSRLARLLSSRLYTLFVALVGASIPLSQALVRYRGSRLSTESHNAPHEPPLPLRYHSDRFELSPSSSPMMVTGYLGVAYMLFAAASAIYRLFSYRAARRAQLESSDPHMVILFDYALSFYPFVLGAVTATMGFLATYVERESAPRAEFTVIMQYAAALLGVFVTLLPTFWTTLQCWGVPLRSILREYQEKDIRAAYRCDTRDLPISPLQDCQTTLEGQYHAALETYEDGSSSEWDADDDD